MTADDARLGLDAEIPRRDFLYGSLLGEWASAPTASPLELLAESGAARPGRELRAEDYAIAGRGGEARGLRRLISLEEALSLPGGAEEAREAFDLVVVAAGLSGLAAAFYFSQARPRASVLILEAQEEFGGNARWDELRVRGSALRATQASTVIQALSPAMAVAAETERIFDTLGIRKEQIQVPEDQHEFSFFLDESLGTGSAGWYPSLLEAPLPDRVKTDLGRFFGSLGSFYSTGEWQRKLRKLDEITFSEFVSRQGWSEGLFRLLRPQLGAFFGFPDVVSAAAVYAHYAASAPRPIYAFAEGNAGLARRLVARLIPNGGVRGAEAEIVDFAALDRPEGRVRLRLGAAVVRVEHEPDLRNSSSVQVAYAHRGRLRRVRARGAVLAAGGFVHRRIAADMPEAQRQAYARFTYAPVLWANVALANSRALDRAQLPFLSAYLEGLGSVLLRYEKMGRDSTGAPRDAERPGLLGIGCPRSYTGLSAGEQEQRAKQELVSTSFREYERRIREDLDRVLGPYGFEARNDIAAVSLYRWVYHSYVFPYPGFFTGDAAEVAGRGYGRVALAHTDLQRFSTVLGAVEQGRRAAAEIQERI